MLIYLTFLCIITILIIAILLHPEVCIAGASSGLLVWFNSVLPSLFPFMVLTGLLIRLNLPGRLSSLLKKYRGLGHLPVSFLFAVIIGLLCGYPMGMRTISELRESEQLSRRQSTLLISFVNQPGPMFILGYALPMCGLDRQHSTLFIFAFYGGVLLTATLLGISLLVFQKNYSSEKHDTVKPENKYSRKAEPIFCLFEETILSSMITLTKIGGYMMLFSLILALIKHLLPDQPEFVLILGGLLEMTSGIAGASALSNNCIPYLILGFVSFGGLCVTAQSFSLGKLSTKEQCYYLLAKSVQTVLSLMLFSLLAGRFPG